MLDPHKHNSFVQSLNVLSYSFRVGLPKYKSIVVELVSFEGWKVFNQGSHSKICRKALDMQPSIGSFPSWRFSNGKTCHVVMDLPWYWLDLNDFSWDDLTVDYSHFWKNTEQSAGDTFIDDSKVGQIHYTFKYWNEKFCICTLEQIVGIWWHH